MDAPFADVAAVAAHYDRLAVEHGDHRLAVGWEWAHTQQVCFAQMCALDGLTDGVSLLDLGCGLGHFGDYLDAHGLDVDYVGWDISPELIAQARARRPDLRFEVRDVLVEPSAERFDYVVASGVLYMRLPDHEPWLADMLRALFTLARRGLGFTMLSEPFARREPLSISPALYYADPARILSFCMDLSPQVELDHNRLSHSFAVRMYRQNTEPMRALADDLKLGRAHSPAHDAVLDHYKSFFMFDALIEYLHSLEPSAEVWNEIGMAAFHLGDSERQIDAFERARAMAPEVATYHRHLAIAYLDAERPAESLAVLHSARERFPDDPGIAEYLHMAERAAGNR